MLWTGRPDRFTVNLNEFFNRSVGRVYYLDAPTPGGLFRDEASPFGRARGSSYARTGNRCASATCSSTARSTRTASRSRGTSGKGLTLYRLTGPLVSTTSVAGLYPTTRWSGRTVRYTRLRCRGGTLTVSLSSDPSLFRDDQRVVARVGREPVARASRAAGRGRSSCASRSRRAAAAASSSSRSRGRWCRAAATPARSAPTSTRFASRLAARNENRARRQPALAPAHGRRQLHPRLARRARRGRRRRARDRRASRRRASAAPGRSARALEGIPRRRLRSVPLPSSHAVRTAWSRLGRPPIERFLGPVDVLHFSDWMVPPQRAGVRATMVHDLVPLRFPEWVTPRTRSMHGVKYARTARTATSSSSTRRTPAATSSSGSGVAAGADPRRAARGRAASSAPTASGPTSARRTSSPWRRSSRARTSRPSSAAHRLLGGDLLLAVAGGAGLGRPARARRAARRPARLRLRRGARPALPGSGGRRLPVALRGLRHADHRGDGLRRPRRRVLAPVAWTRRAATRPYGPIPTIPRRSRRDRGGARAAGRARPARPRARAPVHVARRRRGRSCAATRRRQRDRRARRSTSRRSCRRGRVRRATSAGCSGRSPAGPASSSTPRLVRRAGPARRRSRATRSGTPLALAPRRGLDVLHCTTFRGPLRSPRAGHASPSTTSPCSGIPRRFPRVAPALRRVPALAPRRAARPTRLSPSPSSRSARSVELLGVPDERVRVIGNAVEPVFTPDGPAAEGDYVLAVGTLRAAQEPRARIVEAARRAGVELRVVGARGLGWRRRAGLGRRGSSDEELAALYRGARASSSRRSTRASASRCSRRWRAAPRS